MKEILKEVFKAFAILAFVILAIGAILFLFVISQLIDA
jgi:hypothetical protein